MISILVIAGLMFIFSLIHAAYRTYLYENVMTLVHRDSIKEARKIHLYLVCLRFR